MESALRELQVEGQSGLSVDGDFLDAVESVPRCAGVSVGMDRMAMIALDVDDIAKVVFPFEKETT